MSLLELGYEILPGVLDHVVCRQIQDDVQRVLDDQTQSEIEGKRGARVGGRNLQQLWGGWRTITQQPTIAEFLHDHVGQQAGLVRILYFDKPPGAGWSLALHRDQTIAVKDHLQPPEPFRNPTRKAGVNHVVATDELLSQMLTLRLHLDPMHSHNGPLIVVPGSHRTTDSVESAEAVIAGGSVEVHCLAGDVFAMRPLLSHGSIACDPEAKDHRRVVHLEFAPTKTLPGGYRWYQFDSVTQ